MLGVSAAKIQDDRLGALSALQTRYGGTLVLKGSRTLVSDGSPPGWVIPTGNPGMATGGMGDVLTGLIAGLVARGVPGDCWRPLGLLSTAQRATRPPGGTPGNGGE